MAWLTNDKVCRIWCSGPIRVGADFLHRYFPQAQVWISDPSWENHRAIFEGANCTVNTYPCYDAATARRVWICRMRSGKR